MEMRMRQLGTPQHPSTQKNHWGIRPHEFRTPQHPSTGANHWGGADSHRLEFRTPQPEYLGTHEYWEGDLTPARGTPRRTAAAPAGKHYWGTVDGKRQFGTPLSPAAFGAKNLIDRSGGDLDVVLVPRQFRTPQHPAADGKNHWGTVDGSRQFGTPQHPSAFREFRTPQHPSQGTNNWGGASPLLARNIPQESLDRRYERLNTIRTQDVIFTPDQDQDDDDYDDFQYSTSRIEPKYSYGYATPNPNPDPDPDPNPNPNPPSSRRRRRGLLWKLIKKEPRDQTPKVLGNPPKKKKKKWFPRLDVQKRWPTGWY